MEQEMISAFQAKQPEKMRKVEDDGEHEEAKRV